VPTSRSASGRRSLTWEPAPRWSVGAGGAVDASASRGLLRLARRAARRVAVVSAPDHLHERLTEWHRDPAFVPVSTTYYWGTSLGMELVPAARVP
jgi:hypothetical protein